MNPLDWLQAQSKPVQLLVVLAVLIAAASVATGALASTALLGTFLTDAGESPGATQTPTATPTEGTATPGTTTATTATPPESPPRVQFSLSSSDDGGTITHAGGDSVRAGWLEVVVEGEADGSWATRDDAREASDDVTEGATITVAGVASGDAIELVWTPPDREPTTLARFTVY